MKKKFTVFAVVAIVLFTCPLNAQQQTGKETNRQKNADAISQVKLQASALPEDLKIVKEVSATREQLKKVSTRVGFPVVSLVNQALSSENEQAQVNYLLVQNDSWLVAGYSFLTEADGKKSMIFNKGRVLIEVGATKPELEARISHLLGADPIHFLKLRLRHAPELWELMKEKIYLSDELTELRREMNSPVEAALVQEFTAGHTFLNIYYYRCNDSTTGMKVANQAADLKKPILKLLIGVSGPFVVVAESQNEEINKQALKLVHWPAECELQLFPILWN